MTWGLVCAIETFFVCRQMVRERGFQGCRRKISLHVLFLVLLVVDCYFDFLETAMDHANGLIFHLALRFLAVSSAAVFLHHLLPCAQSSGHHKCGTGWAA
jgi:hypothetical protein